MQVCSFCFTAVLQSCCCACLCSFFGNFFLDFVMNIKRFCFESAFVLLFNKFLEIFLFIFCCLNVCDFFFSYLIECVLWYACFHCFLIFFFYLFISNACASSSSFPILLGASACICVYFSFSSAI